MKRLIQSKFFLFISIITSFLLIIVINIIAAKFNYGMEGDEVFSYISSNSMGGFKEVCFLQDQTWYNSNYFSDALVATGNECYNFKMVVENQAMDTHPPLFYIFLNSVTSFFSGKFSRWFGVGLNIFFMLLVWIALYQLLYYFIHQQNLSMVYSTIFCCSRFSVNMVLFIRMYVLLMALCLAQTNLHLKTYDKMIEVTDFSFRKHRKDYILLSLWTILGAMTHYYFIIYQCLISILYVMGLLINKKKRNSIYYICSMIFSALIYIILYPAVLNHLFFKYRGRDAIHKFLKGSSLFNEIISMFNEYNSQVFKGLLIPVIILFTFFTILLLLYKKITLASIIHNIIYIIPVSIFFGGISKASPFVSIRYISPIVAVLFAFTVIWGVKIVNHTIVKKPTKNYLYTLTCLMFALICIYFYKIPIKEPFFAEKRDVMNYMADNTDYCVYISGDSYNWKMWEDYIYYPDFKGLFFIDGIAKKLIVDSKLYDLKNLTIFIDNSLDKDVIIDYLKCYLPYNDYNIKYISQYTYIIMAKNSIY